MEAQNPGLDAEPEGLAASLCDEVVDMKCRLRSAEEAATSAEQLGQILSELGGQVSKDEEQAAVSGGRSS